MIDYNFKRIDADLLLDNPYRDFDINPPEEKQIAELIRSYNESGDFGVLTVRPIGDKYEIAAGHHRLRAMQALNFARIDCKVGSLSDDEMIRLMVNENATQHGGKPASQSDSVAAASRRIATWMFLCDNHKQFNEMATSALEESSGKNFPHGWFGHNGAFVNSKNELTHSGVVSQRSVGRYLSGAINTQDINSILDSLVEDGAMRKVIAKAQADAHAEEERLLAIIREDEEKEERKRQAAEEKERRETEAAKRAAQRALEAAKRAEERAKAAADATVKAEAARKAREAADAEKKQREAEQRAKARQQARDEQVRQEQVNRERQAEQRRLREERAAAALKAQEEAAENAVIHPEVRQLVHNQNQYREFRKMVKANPDVLGKDNFDQPRFLRELAESMRADSPEAKDKSREDKSFLKVPRMLEELAMVDKRIKDAREKLQREQEERRKHSSLEREVDADVRALFAALSALDKPLRKVHQHLNNPQAAELVMAHSYARNMPDALRGIDDLSAGIKQVFGIYVAAVGDSKQAIDGEKVIN